MPDIPIHRARWQLKDNETFRIRFKVLEPESGIVKVYRSGLETNNESYEHWVEFKMWDYETMIKLKKSSTKYHNETRTFYVDQDFYDELKIKNLMKSWSFGEVDPHMKLQHFNGVMTDESFGLIKRLYPFVVTKIIQEMNAVLEGY